jgi:hypothetical protein
LERHLLPALLVAVSLIVALIIRASDGTATSIVNIAQFEKLMHPTLFDTPDGCTLPKLLPIMLFGGFHWLTESYGKERFEIIGPKMISGLPLARIIHGGVGFWEVSGD